LISSAPYFSSLLGFAKHFLQKVRLVYRNVNLDAHLAALLFLGASFSLLILLLASLLFYFSRRHWVRRSLWAAAGLIALYVVAVIAFSAFSHERILAMGQEKYFCELDCHVAYSIQNVQRMKQIGNTVANGEYYVVTMRSRFDETTTAPWRPHDRPVTPNPLNFTLVDAHGDLIGMSTAGQDAWSAAHGLSPSLFKPLLPGESREATLVFDVPPGMGAPRLLASFGVFPTQILIGDESSLLHRKTYFAL
jgi:hypothetical protein